MCNTYNKKYPLLSTSDFARLVLFLAYRKILHVTMDLFSRSCKEALA